MGAVRLATLVQDLSPAGKGINHAVRAIVLTDQGEVEAYVKKLSDPREIAIECLCAALGRALNLPVPEPLLVQVPSSDGSESSVAFGSVAVNAPDISTGIHGNIAELIQKLKDWEALAKAGCFDEWVANYDRNQQNLLFDGVDKFWLIDHGRCMPPDMSPAAPTPEGNALLAIATSDASEGSLLKVREKIACSMDSFAAFRSDQILHISDSLREKIGGEICDSLAHWLELRQPHLMNLGSARVPARQGDLLNGGAQP